MSDERPSTASILDISLRTVVGMLFVAGMLATIILGAPAAEAQTYQVIYTFTEQVGVNPVAGLTLDKAGNLYGTTNGRGDHRRHLRQLRLRHGIQAQAHQLQLAL
jgi:hypothetical protein